MSSVGRFFFFFLAVRFHGNSHNCKTKKNVVCSDGNEILIFFYLVASFTDNNRIMSVGLSATAVRYPAVTDSFHRTTVAGRINRSSTSVDNISVADDKMRPSVQRGLCDPEDIFNRCSSKSKKTYTHFTNQLIATAMSKLRTIQRSECDGRNPLSKKSYSNVFRPRKTKPESGHCISGDTSSSPAQYPRTDDFFIVIIIVQKCSRRNFVIFRYDFFILRFFNSKVLIVHCPRH